MALGQRIVLLLSRAPCGNQKQSTTPWLRNMIVCALAKDDREASSASRVTNLHNSRKRSSCVKSKPRTRTTSAKSRITNQRRPMLKHQHDQRPYELCTISLESVMLERLYKCRSLVSRLVAYAASYVTRSHTYHISTIASFNEKLLLSNGLVISPLKNAALPNQHSRSLKEVIQGIDNNQDFESHIKGFYSQVTHKGSEPKYERNPVRLQRPLCR